MSNQYAHLLSSAVAAKAKEVDGGNNAKPMKGESEPANDKEDGKKAKSESEEEDEDEGKEKEKKEDKEEDKETERENLKLQQAPMRKTHQHKLRRSRQT